MLLEFFPRCADENTVSARRAAASKPWPIWASKLSGKFRRRRCRRVCAAQPTRLVCLTLLLILAVAPVFAQPEGLPGILGTDDRIPRDSVDWPWAAIGRLNRASGGFCTATLVGPRHVLTAAHCLFDRRMHRILPEDLHFVAGYRRGEYLAHSVARDLILPKGYRPDMAAKPEMLSKDWAIIILRDPIGLRPIPLHALDTADGVAAGKTLLRAGYSQDRAHLLSVHEGCDLAGSAIGGLLLHRCDATHGDSGSPLLLRTGKSVAIIGIDVGAGRVNGAEYGLAVPATAFEATLKSALEEE